MILDDILAGCKEILRFALMDPAVALILPRKLACNKKREGEKMKPSYEGPNPLLDYL